VTVLSQVHTGTYSNFRMLLIQNLINVSKSFQMSLHVCQQQKFQHVSCFDQKWNIFPLKNVKLVTNSDMLRPRNKEQHFSNMDSMFINVIVCFKERNTTDSTCQHWVITSYLGVD